MEYVDVGNFYSFDLVLHRLSARLAQNARVPARGQTAKFGWSRRRATAAHHAQNSTGMVVAGRLSRRCVVATAIRLRAITESLRDPWASPTFESMREHLRGARRNVTTV